MVVASVGGSLAADLGVGAAFADEEGRLCFGRLDPLVNLIHETPANRILQVAVERLRQGTPMRDLVAAAALANARTFGGEDYVGFHTMMAIAPSYHMAQEMPENKRALPVLKVLHRNSSRIQGFGGGPSHETLQPVRAGTLPAGRPGADVLREAVRGANMAEAE